MEDNEPESFTIPHIYASDNVPDHIRADPYGRLLSNLGLCQHPTCMNYATLRPVAAQVPKGAPFGPMTWYFHLCNQHQAEFKIWVQHEAAKIKAGQN